MRLEMMEMSCPDFYATHLGKVEDAGGGNIRLYLCTRHGGHLEPVYSVVIPGECLHQMAMATAQVAEPNTAPLLTAH